jgi:hypothetical protein
MSKANVPMLADVLIHYDSLNHEYCKTANDATLPLWARHAANRARLKLNKHYAISDSSYLYRLALRESNCHSHSLETKICVVLNPSNRKAYLKKVEWKPEWIEEACELAVEYWAKYYKPDNYATSSDDTSSQSQFDYSVSIIYHLSLCHLVSN